jgi:hypothetical protein
VRRWGFKELHACGSELLRTRLDSLSIRDFGPAGVMGSTIIIIRKKRSKQNRFPIQNLILWYLDHHCYKG